MTDIQMVIVAQPMATIARLAKQSEECLELVGITIVCKENQLIKHAIKRIGNSENIAQ